MPTPGSFADTVKQQADIVRVIGEYVKLKKSGAQNFSGICPFHKEKTGSFSVHATRQFYHCFGCGVSGDVFSFIQKIENVTFPEAVRLLAQKLGIAAPKQQYDSPAEAREAKQRGILTEIQEKACAFFQEQLRRPEAAKAREYLAGRGLSEQMIRDFRIGYAPDSGFILRDRLKNDYDEETLKASGLFSWKETQPSPANDQRPTTDDHKPNSAAIYSKFRDRIIFPICNDSGRVIAFTGRRLSADEKAGPKYLNSPETPIYSKSRVLFNLDKAKEHIRKLEYAIVVEGQMDCISVYNAGFHNVIASSGTAFTEMHAKLLGRSSKQVVVNFDPDTAGATATERTLALLVEEDFSIKVLTLEPGLDPDLYIRQRGKEGYAAALKGSQRYFDYLIARAQKQFPPRNADMKVKALNFLLPHVQRVPSRIVRDELAGDIAQKLGIDDAVLRQELRKAATSRSTNVVKAAPEAQITDAERVLIRALSPGDPNGEPVRARAIEVLAAEHLTQGLPTESLLVALAGADALADPTSLPLAAADHRLLASVLMNEGEELTPELLESAFDALRRRRLEHRQRELGAELATAERKGDNDRLLQLLKEKAEIDKALGDFAVAKVVE
jgi:DNA primase